MERLWAPWRIKYLKDKKQKGCIFCRVKKKKSKNYIVFKTKYSLCMLNLYPYNNGHLLVAPQRHIRNLCQLKKQETLDLFSALNLSQKLLDQVLKPQGYNIGINLFRASGAGITGHLHIHLVPRWHGDTNFMPVLSKSKVISQSLDELYKQLKSAYAKRDSRI